MGKGQLPNLIHMYLFLPEGLECPEFDGNLSSLGLAHLSHHSAIQ